MELKDSLQFLVIEGHFIVKDGLKEIIMKFFKNSTVVFSDNREKAIAIVKDRKIDIVITNSLLNDDESVSIINKIKKANTNSKVIIYSLGGNDMFGTRYIHNGADAFLHRQYSKKDFIRIINEVIQKGYYYNTELFDSEIIKKPSKKWHENIENVLSKREHQIAFMLISGYKNVDIAKHLNIKMQSVSTYKRRIFEKFSIDNIIQLSEIISLREDK